MMARSQNKTKTALAFFAGLSAIIAPAYILYAAEKAPELILATVYVTDASVKSANGEYEVSFAIGTGSIPEPSVRYGLLIYSETTNGPVLVDRMISEEHIVLQAGESKQRTMRYDPPLGVSGSLRIMIESKNSAGVPLAEAFAGTIGAKRDGGIVIRPETCALTIEGEKEGGVHSITEGVDINSEEKLLLSCAVSNTSGIELAVTPEFTTHFRSPYGELISPNSTEGNNAITIMPANEQNITLTIPTATVPQAYDAVVGLRYGTQRSNAIAVHYVVRGPSATIIRVDKEKESYRTGEIANIHFFWGSSADNFPNSRVGTGSPSATNYRVSVFDASGEKCGIGEGKLPLGIEGSATTTILRDCAGASGLLELFGDNNALLASAELANHTEGKSSKKFLLSITCVLFLSALVFLTILMWRRRSSKTAPLVVLLVIVGCTAALGYVSTTASAAAGPGTLVGYVASQGSFVYVTGGTMYSITCGNPLSQQGQPCRSGCVNFDISSPAGSGPITTVAGRPVTSITYNTTAPALPLSITSSNPGIPPTPISLAPILISGPRWVSAGTPYVQYQFRSSNPTQALPNNEPVSTFLGGSSWRISPRPTAPSSPSFNKIYVQASVDGSGIGPLYNDNFFNAHSIFDGTPYAWPSPDAATMFPNWTYSPNPWWYDDAVYRTFPQNMYVNEVGYMEVGPLSPGAHIVRAQALYVCFTQTYVLNYGSGSVSGYSNTSNPGCDQSFYLWAYQACGSYCVLPAHSRYYTLSRESALATTVSFNSPPSDPLISAPDGLAFTSVLASVQSFDPDGDNLTYYWDWNLDGVADATRGPFASGSSPAVPTPATWGLGPHTFRVRVFDGTYYNPSGWMNYSINLRAAPNIPPSDPTVTIQPTGIEFTSYSGSAWSTDPDGDPIQYGFDWNLDGAIDFLSPAVPSGPPGVSAPTPASWGTGPHTFRVLAIDDELTSENWGEGTITLSSFINELPLSVIETPSSDTTISYGGNVSALGHGTDTDGPPPAVFEWREGNCVTGTLLNTNSGFTYSGLVAGPHQIYLRVQDSMGQWSTNCPSVTITVSPPIPILSVAPVGQDFSLVNIYESSSRIFTVTNTGPVGSLLSGNVPTSVTSSDVNFVCTAGCLYTDLAVGVSWPVTITFTPSSIGTDSGSITFTNTQSSSVAASVWGEGVAPISILPSSIDFGRVLVSKWKERTVIVTNTGSVDLGTTGINIPAPFACMSGCTLDLSPAVVNTVTIKFSPLAAGIFSETGSLVAFPAVTFSLIGEGVTPSFNFIEI
jgi:hypothetical protein